MNPLEFLNYPEDNKNIDSTVDDSEYSIFMLHANDRCTQRNILRSLAIYCYSLGYERGYKVGHKHGKTGKDDRVTVHLN